MFGSYRRIEAGSEVFKLPQYRSDVDIRMLGVEEDTDNGLRGTSILNHLLGKKYFVQSIILYYRSGTPFARLPLEQKHKPMARSGHARTYTSHAQSSNTVCYLLEFLKCTLV